jgi:hypothetical protein
MLAAARSLAFDKKSMPMVAWYMLSKESYMNRVIRDVFPTVSSHGQLSSGACRGWQRANRTTLFAEEDQSARYCQVSGIDRDGFQQAYLNFLSGLLYDPPAPAEAMLDEFSVRTAEKAAQDVGSSPLNGTALVSRDDGRRRMLVGAEGRTATEE